MDGGAKPRTDLQCVGPGYAVDIGTVERVGGPGPARIAGCQVAEELDSQPGQVMSGQQRGVGLAMPETAGDVIGDEPFDHREVDEPEQSLVSAGQQTAGPDGVGDLLGGHASFCQRGEGIRDLVDLVKAQERLL